MIIWFVVTLPIASFASEPPAPLPQTGQTTCYDGTTTIACAGTRQDGELQMGAAWPSPRFTDNGDQTMNDNLTGLVWSKDGNSPGPAACGPATTKTWQGALDYVQCLNANSWRGKTDWRLPNQNEMASVVHQGKANSASWLNSQGFVNAQADKYWTSSSFAYSTGFAWYVYMGSGYVNGDGKAGSHYVWPVRSVMSGILTLPKTGQTSCYDTTGAIIACTGTGQDGELLMGAAWPSPRFTDNGDQTMTDNLTGLLWSKDANAPGPAVCGPGTNTYRSWQGALDYVKCLNQNGYLGKTDWRLPNRNELASLVNQEQSSPAAWLFSSGFTNVQDNFYWSSSSYAYSTFDAWAVYMTNGYVINKGKSFTFYAMPSVWPVRGGTWGKLTLSPGTYTFANTEVGTASTTREFTIANSGASSVQINGITLTGADAAQFAVAPGGVMACASLTPTLDVGASCTVQVVFMPTLGGTKSASLHTAYTSAYSRTIDVPLSGTGFSTTPFVTGYCKRPPLGIPFLVYARLCENHYSKGGLHAILHQNSQALLRN